uniref:hypothetical protein n=1 Tax=Alistipes shahii TaxID=328814 RepID=UPI003FED604F
PGPPSGREMAYVSFALGLQSGCLRFFFVVALPGGVVAAFGVVYKPDPGKFSHLIRGVPPRIQF